MSNKLKPMRLGDLEIKVPIFQGGMGVKVSTAPLAAAVAECGGAGTIASVGLAYGVDETKTTFVKESKIALRDEIRKARQLTKGVIGVNIMVALSNYEDLINIAVEEKADFIVSGAGLPISLPELVKGSDIKLLPIVSSGRAADIILKSWKRRYNRLPDAIVVEGPKAGGHLGFRSEGLKTNTEHNLESILAEVQESIKGFEYATGRSIPIVVAGGIFDGKDIVRFIKLGASAVQMATRFVATNECAVADAFKQLYLSAKDEDVVIIDSPVGMPGRTIMTPFVKRVLQGERVPFKCSYKCLRSCDPATVPYCIARALCNASIGDIQNSVVFAGSNVSRVKEIVSVKHLMDELIAEAEANLQ